MTETEEKEIRQYVISQPSDKDSRFIQRSGWVDDASPDIRRYRQVWPASMYAADAPEPPHKLGGSTSQRRDFP
jgi:hypothetical protein